MLLKDLPSSHLDAIKQSLQTGFMVYAPDDIDRDLHHPFKTNDGKVVGMIDYRSNVNIADAAVRLALSTPFVKFNYQYNNEKLCSELTVMNSGGSVHRPRYNKEAAVCIYVAINVIQGHPKFKDLGEAWRKELSPTLGG